MSVNRDDGSTDKFYLKVGLCQRKVFRYKFLATPSNQTSSSPSRLNEKVFSRDQNKSQRVKQYYQ